MDEQSRLAMYAAFEQIYKTNPQDQSRRYIHGNIILVPADPNDPDSIQLIALQIDDRPIDVTYSYQGKSITEQVVLPYAVFMRPSKDPKKRNHFHYHVLSLKPLGSGAFASAFTDEFDISRKNNKIIVEESNRKALKIYKNTPEPTARNEHDRMNQAYPYKRGSKGHARGKHKVGLVSHYNGSVRRNILYGKRFKGVPLLDALCNYQFSYPERLLIINNLIRELMLLHKRGVLHRDLKLENIMFDPITFKVKIIDFGLSDEMSNISERVSGSPFMLGPETLSLKTGAVKQDLSKLDHYALAGIIAEILGGNATDDKAAETIRLINAKINNVTSVIKTPYNFNDLTNSTIIDANDKAEIITWLQQLSADDPKDRPDLNFISEKFAGLLKPYRDDSKEQLITLIERAEEPLKKYEGKRFEKIAAYQAKLGCIKNNLTANPENLLTPGSKQIHFNNYKKAFIALDKIINSNEFTEASIQAEFGEHQDYCFFSLKAMLFKLKSWWPHILGGSSKGELLSKHGWHNTNSLNCAIEYRKQALKLYENLKNHPANLSTKQTVGIS